MLHDTDTQTAVNLSALMDTAMNAADESLRHWYGTRDNREAEVAALAGHYFQALVLAARTASTETQVIYEHGREGLDVLLPRHTPTP